METTGVIWIYEVNYTPHGSSMEFAERESHEKAGIGGYAT